MAASREAGTSSNELENGPTGIERFGPIPN